MTCNRTYHGYIYTIYIRKDIGVCVCACMDRDLEPYQYGVDVYIASHAHKNREDWGKRGESGNSGDMKGIRKRDQVP